jgi:hypothetical protein
VFFCFWPISQGKNSRESAAPKLPDVVGVEFFSGEVLDEYVQSYLKLSIQLADGRVGIFGVVIRYRYVDCSRE